MALMCIRMRRMWECLLQGAEVPYKTLLCACGVSIFGQKEYPNFRFGPSYRFLLLKPILSLF
ncbi:CCT_1a_G0035060.mRNA.1.CDS.1 [Saccharomyces cerevisiae]|nr:CCT_1a_G0035060.mRNA.1.CDS.1 [Saccharomyces cerevisiae]CAI7401127.1 CCT_1a_G0035060.mRNA.1.CDS.1 [Saccharomyces cerevisiae]